MIKIRIKRDLLDRLLEEFRSRKFASYHDGMGLEIGVYEKDGKIYVYEQTGWAFDSYGPTDCWSYLESEIQEVEIYD